MQYGVSAFGVTTALSSGVNRRASQETSLNGPLYSGFEVSIT